MKRRDKWNKELDRLSAISYKEMDKEVYTFYKEALTGLKAQLKDYIDAYDELSFSKKLEVDRQIVLANQINDILVRMDDKVQPKIREFIAGETNYGYYGTWYQLEGLANVNLDFPLLNENYIKQLIDKKINGKLFSSRLYTNREKLAEQVLQSILNNLIAGKGYAYAAKEIAELTEASYKQALRIARTEGGRAQSSTRQRAYETAKEKGVQMEKKWVSTLDKKTRISHQKLDGQVVAVDEQFVFNGYTADGPRLFGQPGLDINCRCTTVAVVRGLSPDLRRDNETSEVIDYVNYPEWLEAKKKKGEKP